MALQSPGIARARRWVLAMALLLAMCVAAAALRTAAWPGGALLALVLLVPIALPLPGLLRRHRRTYAWSTLCVAPYFIYGITEVVANPAVRQMAGAILFASLALFLALVAYLRLTRATPASRDQPGA